MLVSLRIIFIQTKFCMQASAISYESFGIGYIEKSTSSANKQDLDKGVEFKGVATVEKTDNVGDLLKVNDFDLSQFNYLVYEHTKDRKPSDFIGTIKKAKIVGDKIAYEGILHTNSGDKEKAEKARAFYHMMTDTETAGLPVSVSIEAFLNKGNAKNKKGKYILYGIAGTRSALNDGAYITLKSAFNQNDKYMNANTITDEELELMKASNPDLYEVYLKSQKAAKPNDTNDGEDEEDDDEDDDFDDMEGEELDDARNRKMALKKASNKYNELKASGKTAKEMKEELGGDMYHAARTYSRSIGKDKAVLKSTNEDNDDVAIEAIVNLSNNVDEIKKSISNLLDMIAPSLVVSKGVSHILSSQVDKMKGQDELLADIQKSSGETLQKIADIESFINRSNQGKAVTSVPKSPVITPNTPNSKGAKNTEGYKIVNSNASIEQRLAVRNIIKSSNASQSAKAIAEQYIHNPSLGVKLKAQCAEILEINKIIIE